MIEYEYALNCLLWGRWDDLFTIMLRTDDDVLKKKIHQFLHAYYYAHEQQTTIETHDQLHGYLEHAKNTIYISI